MELNGILKNKFVQFVIAVRIFSAILILIFPLYGFLVYLLLDYWDAHYLINVHKVKWNIYQDLDKKLDIFGDLAMSYWVVKIGGITMLWFVVVVILYRLLGQYLFTKFHKQRILVLFPNFIEVLYVVFVLFSKYGNKMFLLVLFVVIKLIQEIFLHDYWPRYLRKNGYPVLIRVLGVKNRIDWN